METASTRLLLSIYLTTWIRFLNSVSFSISSIVPSTKSDGGTGMERIFP